MPLRFLKRAPVADLACALALLGCCLSEVSAIANTVDLTFWDEADYLRRGVQAGERGLPKAEWGPLYALWYHLLSRTGARGVELYELSYGLLLALPALLIYVCGRRFALSPPLALAGGVLFLLSGAPHVLPRPALLALLVLLVALIAASRLRLRIAAFAVLGSGFALASFARPELTLGVGICTAALLVESLRERPRAVWGVMGAYVAAVTVLVLLFGSPTSDTSNRRFYAFCQHFALGHVLRTGMAIEPWGQCAEAIQREFGPHTDSVLEALRANPRALARHVLHNVGAYPEQSMLLLLGQDTKRVPPAAPVFGGLLCLAAVGYSGLSLRLREAWRLESLRVLGLATLAALAPTLASIALIAPRPHYLVLQSVLAPLFLLALFSSARREGRQTPAWIAAAALAALALLSPLLSPSKTGALPHRETLAELKRELDERVGDAAGTLNLLEVRGGYDAYLGAPWASVPVYTKASEEPFFAWLRRTRTHALILDDSLMGHWRFRDDPEFQAFVKAPARYGFELRPLNGTAGRLAIAPASFFAGPGGSEGQADLRHPRSH